MVHTEEYKEKVRKTMKVVSQDPEFKRTSSEGSLAYWNKPGSKERMSLRMVEYYKNPIHRIEQRRKQIEYWSNPLHREKQRQIINEAILGDSDFRKKCLCRKSKTNEEAYLEQLLSSEYKFVGNGQLWIGGKNPDFVSVDNSKRLVELWGDYFHKGQNPFTRILYFKLFGFDTLVIWASELKHYDQVMLKIHDFGRNQ